MDNQPGKTQSEKCMECRECCEYVEFPVTAMSIEVLEYFLFRGEQMYIDPVSGFLMIRQHKPCVHLTDAGCSVYDKRPDGCRLYMCAYKDSSIKQAKLEICQDSMAKIQEAIDKHKEEQKWQPVQPS